MKHLFIINPAAGKKNQSVDFVKKIAALCKPQGLDYDIKVSAYKGNCTELARQAAKTGEEYRIYACGGDGTLNEVINGVVGYDNVAVTHFPGGSGNDFIRMFSDPSAFSDLSRLLDADEVKMDLIKVNDVYALNICSMGIDARICQGIPIYKRLPGLGGSAAYNLSTVVNVVKGIHRPYEVEIDGKTLVGNQTLICVCNGRYYGGGFYPVPDAQPDDGLLDVLIIRDVSRFTVAKVVGHYKHGEYKNYPDLITHYRVKNLTVRSLKEDVINADGETTLGKEATFSVLPGALRYFYPKGLTYSAEPAKTEEEAVPV